MKSDQHLYKQLRELSKEQLWNIEVMRFNKAMPRARMEGVAVIRAVGTIFSRFGTEEEKLVVREWLLALLKDSQEKIRRYAMVALPKIGVGAHGEKEILSLLHDSKEEREKRHLGRALEKVGGLATLALVKQGTALPTLTEQKVKAAVSRREHPSTIRLDALLPTEAGLRLHLHCRCGLEEFVREEAEEVFFSKKANPPFRLAGIHTGCVTLIPTQAFSLAMLYRLRCFATLGFSLGVIQEGPLSEWGEALAHCIGSSRTRKIMLSATEGAARYRLDFPSRGHQRGAIRQIIERAYALSPEILNDSRQAPWSVDVLPTAADGKEASVELRPRLYPDPRLFYRQDDVAAASHPPLAACMARLAEKGGLEKNAVIWDPFCGSGLELIERALRGGVARVYGTDLASKAIEVARANFAAARLEHVPGEFICCDFRDARHKTGISPASLSLIITNPPLGRRVRVKDMRGLFADLIEVAFWALRPGGRLIFVNPLRTSPSEHSWKQEYRQMVNLGGFNCHLEMYRKLGR